MGIAADFVNEFVEPLDTFITNGVSELARAIEGPLIAGATLYIVIFGILIVLGYVRAPISDFIANVFKITILVALCTNVDTYTAYVKDFFFADLPDGISSAIGHVPGSDTPASDVSSGAVFDTIIDQLINLIYDVYRQWSWDNWFPLLVVTLLGLGLIPVAALLAVVLFAKVGLTLLIVLGPIFIALYLFNATSSFTASWISGLATFAALQVLAIAFIALLTSIVSGFLSDAQDLEGVQQINAALRLVGLFVISMALALLLPQIAAQLAGGGIRAGGGIIHQGIAGARRVSGAAGHTAGRRALAGIRGGYDRIARRSGGTITQG